MIKKGKVAKDIPMKHVTMPVTQLSPRLLRLGDITPIILLVLSSRAETLGMLPFGIAFFAAVSDKSIAYLTIPAICAGIISVAGAAVIPKYMLALLLFMIATRLYRKENELMRSLLCGASLALGGGIMLLVNCNGLYDIFLLLTESLIAALMYLVFGKAKHVSEGISTRGRLSPEEYISTAIAAGVMISGFSGIDAGPVQITGVLSVYTLLFAALNTSVAIAGSAGLCIGFITSMSSPAALVMPGVFGLSAVFACFLSGYKKYGCALGFISGAAISLIYAKNTFDLPLGVYDILIGTALFVITPRMIHEYFRSFFTGSVQIESVSPELRMRDYLSMRLRRTADAFGSLYESFIAVSDGRLKKYSDDIGSILDDTTDRICSGCNMRGKCWQTDFRRTYKNVLELIGIIEAEGVLTAENTPPNFCERCVRTDEFINGINHVYELYRREVLRRSDAVVTRNLISSQYRELNRLFADMSDDIGLGFMFLEDEEEQIVNELDKLGITPYEVSAVENARGSREIYLRLPPAAKHAAVEGAISAALGHTVSFERTESGLSKYVSRPGYVFDSAVLQLPQAGSKTNGDSVTVFGDGRGRFYAIAADGMGSGNEAQYESASALRLLTSFLKAGFGVNTALGILNSSMCLNMDNESYSTIDLLSVDLYTGRAELYKIGSAETLVYNGIETKTLSSVSAPAGIIESIHPDKKVLELKEGDVILMMTDGITEAGYARSKTDWIRSIMIKPHEDMSQLAKEVMDTALRKSRSIAKDDMSVIALRLMSV